MEFYEFYTLVREIAVAYIPSGNDVFLEVYVRNLRSVLLLSLGLGLAVYALLLILGGLGLRKMAAHEGKKHRWMGFVPILNTWYAGYIAGESNFFGQKMKRAGLYAALTEGVGVLFSVFSVLSDFLIVRYPKLETGIGLMQEPQQYVTYNVARLPAWLRPLYGETAQIWLSVIELVIGLLQIVFLYVLFLALFRKYYARSPILFTFLCAVLPVRGIVLFAVRNNKPVDYDAYIRRRMEEAARRTYGPMGPYGGGPYGGGPYNGPYGGQGGPYGGNPGNGPYGGQGNNPGGQGDPFSDFGGGQNGVGTGNGGEKNAPDDGPFSGF